MYSLPKYYVLYKKYKYIFNYLCKATYFLYRNIYIENIKAIIVIRYNSCLKEAVIIIRYGSI